MRLTPPGGCGVAAVAVAALLGLLAGTGLGAGVAALALDLLEGLLPSSLASNGIEVAEPTGTPLVVGVVERLPRYHYQGGEPLLALVGAGERGSGNLDAAPAYTAKPLREALRPHLRRSGRLRLPSALSRLAAAYYLSVRLTPRVLHERREVELSLDHRYDGWSPLRSK